MAAAHLLCGWKSHSVANCAVSSLSDAALACPRFSNGNECSVLQFSRAGSDAAFRAWLSENAVQHQASIPLRVLDAPVVLTLPTPTQPAPHSSRCKKNRLARLPQLHPAEERHPLKSDVRRSTTQAPPLTAAPRPEKTT